MLQKVDFDEDMQEQGQSNLLRPIYYWELLKRRVFYFVIPFVLVASAGIGIALVWPPTYLSEGKILVQSQQIPTELVRPTVTNAAQERIQVIEQRTMTRENLMAIIDKFQLFPDQRNLMSVTQLVDLMKKKASIASLAQPLSFSRRSENPTIVFTVGFEDSDPAIASRVANELVTRILNEDLRDRTGRATDTTKFLSREMQRLQAENAAIEAKIAEAKQSQLKPTSSNGTDSLAQMRADYAQKSAIYSEKHPLMKAMKRQMDAMEKSAGPAASSDGVGLDALQSQQETIQKNLEVASAKFSAAQLGEALEKNQQSEKLEVIEQPTVPQEPIKPNRPKIIGMSLLLALAAGAGLTLLLEMLDSTIRRSADVYSLVDSQLVVSVPYIITKSEQLRSKQRIRLLVFVAVPALLGFLVLVYFMMPPLDLVIAKARVGLFR
jgi:protein tyrosine kinase modulator